MTSTDVFLACYAKFGTASFTRHLARALADDPKIADTMLSNATTNGHLISLGSGKGRNYRFTAAGISRIDTLTRQPALPLGKPTDPPPHVAVGSKDPAAILRTIRRQLEDQIDQIDEALETLRVNETAIANIEKIKALLS